MGENYKDLMAFMQPPEEKYPGPSREYYGNDGFPLNPCVGDDLASAEEFRSDIDVIGEDLQKALFRDRSRAKIHKRMNTFRALSGFVLSRVVLEIAKFRGIAISERPSDKHGKRSALDYRPVELSHPAKIKFKTSKQHAIHPVAERSTTYYWTGALSQASPELNIDSRTVVNSSTHHVDLQPSFATLSISNAPTPRIQS